MKKIVVKNPWVEIIWNYENQESYCPIGLALHNFPLKEDCHCVSIKVLGEEGNEKTVISLEEEKGSDWSVYRLHGKVIDNPVAAIPFVRFADIERQIDYVEINGKYWQLD